MARWWPVRAVGDDFDVELDGASSADAPSSEDAEWLLAQPSSNHVGASLDAIYGALKGSPHPGLGKPPAAGQRGEPWWDEEIRREVRAAVLTRRLRVRRVPRVPVVSSRPEPAPPSLPRGRSPSRRRGFR